jgi:hypothetical protein
MAVTRQDKKKMTLSRKKEDEKMDVDSSSSSSSDSSVDEGAVAVGTDNALATTQTTARQDLGQTTSSNTNSRITKKTEKTATLVVEKKKAEKGNVLTKLLPGYTAPLKLQTTLSGGLPTSDISVLRARATQTEDLSTASAGIHAVAQRERASFMLQNRVLSGGDVGLGSFTQRPKKQSDQTAGDGWFNMQPFEMTDELKTDLKVVQMRGYLDPKRFYKSSDKASMLKGGKRVVQVGTVVEGMGEFQSSRLAKKQRRQNLTEEIMADTAIRNYARKASTKIVVAKETRFYQNRRSKSGRGNKFTKMKK